MPHRARVQNGPYIGQVCHGRRVPGADVRIKHGRGEERLHAGNKRSMAVRSVRLRARVSPKPTHRHTDTQTQTHMNAHMCFDAVHGCISDIYICTNRKGWVIHLPVIYLPINLDMYHMHGVVELYVCPCMCALSRANTRRCRRCLQTNAPAVKILAQHTTPPTHIVYTRS